MSLMPDHDASAPRAQVLEWASGRTAASLAKNASGSFCTILCVKRPAYARP
jgi:hypothetical protein